MWTHELCRAYRDKISSESDLASFDAQVDSVMENTVGKGAVTAWLEQTRDDSRSPILYGDFQDPQKAFYNRLDMSKVKEHLKRCLKRYYSSTSPFTPGDLNVVLTKDCLNLFCRLRRTLTCKGT